MIEGNMGVSECLYVYSAHKHRENKQDFLLHFYSYFT